MRTMRLAEMMLSRIHSHPAHDAVDDDAAGDGARRESMMR